MAEVGGLELQLTTKVDNKLETIIGQLDGISNSLGEVTKNMSSLTKVSESAANSLSSIASAIKGIDAGNISKVSSAINGVEKSAKDASKSVDDMAKSLAGRLGITAKKEVDEVVEAFGKYYSAYKDIVNAPKDELTGEEFKALQQNAAGAGKELAKIISQYARIQGELTEVQKAALDAVSAINKSTSGIRIEEDIMKSFPIEQYQQLRAMLGQGFGVSKEGTEFDSWIKDLVKDIPGLLTEINALYTTTASGYDNVDVFQKLAEYVSEARNNVYSLGDAIANHLVPPTLVGDWIDGYVQNLLAMERETEQAVSQNAVLAQSVNSVADSMAQMGANLNTDGVKSAEVALETVAETAKKAEEAVEPISESIEEISEPLKEVESSTEEVKDSLDEMGKEAEEASKAIDNIAQSAEKSKKAFQGMTAAQIFEDLEREAAEGVEEIQLLIDTIKGYQKIISETESGKMMFDPKYYEIVVRDIDRLKAELAEYKASLKDIPTPEVKNVSTDKAQKDSLKWMAQIIAIQHELEKVSGMFSKFGDIAKNAFLKALTPLKLIQHEFNELKENITRVGSAFALVSKFIAKVYGVLGGLTKRIRDTFNVKNIFKRFVDTASKAFDTITKKWRKVAERFSFTLLRKAINSVINQLNDAMKSLALFSSNIGTDFNSSMSIVTSDIRYLAASIIALLEPLINYFTPILDGLIDQLVNVTNHVNMFIAALTGAKSFTIAKKKIIDYSKALEKANKSAKTLTLGIDELNILNDDKSTEELEDLFEWQELPTPQIDFGFLDGEIVDLIKKILQQIKDLLKAIINAIKEAWRRVADYVLSAAKRLLKAILNLVSDVLRDLIKLFNEEATIKLLETIFRILGDIMNIIAAIIEKIDEAWNHNNLGLKILEKIRDILLVIATHIQNVTEYMVGWAESLTFIPLFESFLNLLNQIEYAVDQIGKVFEDVMISLILPLIKYLIEDAFPKLLDILSSITHAIGNIAKNFHEAWQDVNFGELLTQDITGVTDTILKHLQTIADEFDNWSIDINFRPVMFGIDEVLSALQPLVDSIGNIFDDVFRDVIFPLFTYLIETVIPKLLGVIADIETAFANLADGIHKAWNELDFGSGVMDGIKGIVDTLLKYVGEIGEYFKDWAKQVDFKPLLKGFENLLEALKPVADFVGDVALHAFEALMKYVQHLVEDIFPEWENAIATIANSTNWQTLKETFNSLIDAGEHLLEAIGGGVVKAVENLGIAVAKFADSSAFKEFIKNITDFITKIDADMVAKVLTGIGLAILKIAEAITKFVNSKLVQDFLNALLRFINDSSAEKIADVLLNIAGAFLAFKGISVALKGLSTALSAIALIGNATEGVKKIAEVFKGAKTAAEAAEVATKGVATAAKGVGEATKAAAAGAGEVTTALEGTTTAATGASGALSGIGSAIGTVIQTISGIAAIIGGAILAVKEFVDMWKDGWDVIKTILEALGIALAAVGAVLLGAPAAVAAAVAGIVFAVSQLAILIHQHFDEIVSFIKECWNGITEFFNELWSGIVSLAESVFGTLQEFFTILWSSIVEGIMLAWSGVTEFLSEVWNGIVILAQTIFAVLQEFFTNLWNGIVEIFTSVWSTLQEFLTTLWTELTNLGLELWGNLRDFILNVWSSLQEAAETAWNFINELLTTIWNYLGELAQTVFGGIHDLIVNSWNFIKGLAEEVWNFIKDLVIEVWNSIRSIVTEVVGAIQELISSAWEFIQNITHNIWSEIQQFLEGLWNSIKETAEQIFNLLREFFDGLWNGIKEAWEDIWNAVKSALEAVWNAISETARTIFDAVAQFLSGVWDFLVDAWNSIWTEIKDLVETIWNTIKSIAEEVWGAIVSFFEGLWEGVKNIVVGIAEKFKDTLKVAVDFAKEFVQTGIDAAAEFVKAIWDGLKDLASNVFDVGKNIAEGVWNGLKDGWDWLKNKVADLAGDLVDSVKSFLGIHSPSKVFADEIGKWIPPGIAVGFEKSMPNLLSRMEKAVSGITGINIPHLVIPAYANGGMPEDGLFMMNHNEMYGKFANGRTGVVNNKMMEETMRDAVVNGLVPYLEQIAQNTQETTEAVYSKDLQIGDRTIAQSNNRGQSQIGRTLTKRN